MNHCHSQGGKICIVCQQCQNQLTHHHTPPPTTTTTNTKSFLLHWQSTMRVFSLVSLFFATVQGFAPLAIVPKSSSSSSSTTTMMISRQDFLTSIMTGTTAAAIVASTNTLPAWADDDDNNDMDSTASSSATVTTMDNGVKYTVTKAGDGPKPDIGELAAIRFRAFCGTNKIDDIFDTPEPYYTRIGTGMMLKVRVHKHTHNQRASERTFVCNVLVCVGVLTRVFSLDSLLSCLLPCLQFFVICCWGHASLIPETCLPIQPFLISHSLAFI